MNHKHQLLFSFLIVFSLFFVGTSAFAATTTSTNKNTQDKITTQSKTSTERSSFGVKSIDPFKKHEEKTEIVEERPNYFLDLLERKVILPQKKRPVRKVAPKKTPQEKINELLDQELDNFDPFDETSTAPSIFSPQHQQLLSTHPFASGDPFAYEYIGKE